MSEQSCLCICLFSATPADSSSKWDCLVKLTIASWHRSPFAQQASSCFLFPSDIDSLCSASLSVVYPFADPEEQATLPNLTLSQHAFWWVVVVIDNPEVGVVTSDQDRHILPKEIKRTSFSHIAHWLGFSSCYGLSSSISSLMTEQHAGVNYKHRPIQKTPTRREHVAPPELWCPKAVWSYCKRLSYYITLQTYPY